MQITTKKIIITLILFGAVVFLAHRIFLLSKQHDSGKITGPDIKKGLLNPGEAFAINGTVVPIEKAGRPFAVVVENHVDSRPQSGLSQADLVYEALAEGGITRFLAVFQSEDVTSIGPVRSARTYFNDWAQELKAIYVHVGGNSDALYYIKQGIAGVSDADQFFNDPYFLRVSSRPMPHNTYTSTVRLFALAKARKFDLTPSYESFLFKDDQAAASSEGVVNTISIDFSLPAFGVSWHYDSASNSYIRYQAGKKAIDVGNNSEIEAKNIIIQRVANWPVESDTILAISMGTRDGGDAEYYLDGKKIQGSWKYINGRTKFFKKNVLNGQETNTEMEFNRGKTWIEVVPPDRTVTGEQVLQ